VAAPTLLSMDLEWEQVVVDAAQPRGLARWWAQVLDWVMVDESDEDCEIRPTPQCLPGILFTPVTEAKAGKNRLHLDFRPADQEAEVQRLLRLGATRADIGQGKQSWVVLQDPEGNEFCVLSSRS
jgi:hypothetical protein